jgi:hypothetical protein
MKRFRRSGSPTRFFVEGDAADVSDASLLKGLERERFKPLDGSEPESVGWTTRADPAGTRFEPQDVIHGPYLAFTLRIDRKQVSATLARIQIAADLRGAAKGGRLPREQRKQIIEEAKRKLVERALPSVALVDCLWNCGDGVLLVFATGGRTLETAARQFRETFRRKLEPAGVTTVARRLRLPDEAARGLRECSPIDFAPVPQTQRNESQVSEVEQEAEA